jgi:tetratricopeptide (TPR) repeat protein
VHPEATTPTLVLDLHRRRGEVRALLGGRLQDAVDDLQLVLDAARAAGDQDGQRELLIALGQVYRMADRLDLAMEYLNAALAICRECLDRRSLANVLHHLGTVAWSAGNNLQASIYHQEAADLSRGLDDLDLVTIQALHGRGEAFVAAAVPASALGLFEESLTLARRIGNKRYEAENLQMIGWSYIGLTGIADYGRAYEALNQSLILSRDAHLDWNSSITLAFVGWVHACQGDYGRALEMVQAAIDQLRAADLVRFLSMAYDFLGYIYQDLNLHEQALEAHVTGLQIGIEANVGFWLPRLCADVAIDRLRLGELGAGHDLEVAFSLTVDDYQRFHGVRCLEGLLEEGILTGRPDRTLHFAALLDGISQEGGLREQQVHVLRWRGAAYRLQGKTAQAEELLLAALDLAQTVGRERCIWDLHADLAAFYRELGDLPRAATHETEVAAIVRRIADSLPDPALAAALPRTLLLEH